MNVDGESRVKHLEWSKHVVHLWSDITPPELDTKPENQPLEKEIPNLETIIVRFKKFNFVFFHT